MSFEILKEVSLVRHDGLDTVTVRIRKHAENYLIEVTPHYPPWAESRDSMFRSHSHVHESVIEAMVDYDNCVRALVDEKYKVIPSGGYQLLKTHFST